MPDPVRVLIVDDHMLVREGLRLIFSTLPDLTPVGEARDGLEALEMVAALQPDVVLMDLQMPRLDGISAIQRLGEQHPEVATLILTTYEDDELILQGLQAGARGYLLKDTDQDTLVSAILAAARGEVLLAPEILARLLSARSHSQVAEADPSDLTPRELEVLQLVAEGMRNKEIAYRLGITERTVKAHLQHIYQKFDVDARAAAVSEGARRGVLS